MKTRIKDQSEAAQLLNSVDSERAAFVKRYFGKQWPVRHLYHAMINTLLGDAACVSIISELIEEVNKGFSR